METLSVLKNLRARRDLGIKREALAGDQNKEACLVRQPAEILRAGELQYQRALQRNSTPEQSTVHISITQSSKSRHLHMLSRTSLKINDDIDISPTNPT